MSKMPSAKFWESKTGLGTRNFTHKIAKYYDAVERPSSDPVKTKKYEISDDYRKFSIPLSKLGIVT